MKTIYSELEAKLQEIIELSNKINMNDDRKILKMIKEHVEEIEERYNNQDEHWWIETADLIVLCYELLLLGKKEIDDIFKKCLPRFDVNLKRLIENAI